jgi:hypothetical protein
MYIYINLRMKLVEVYLVGAQLVQQDVSPLVARRHVGLVVAEGHARHGVRPVAPAAHRRTSAKEKTSSSIT